MMKVPRETLDIVLDWAGHYNYNLDLDAYDEEQKKQIIHASNELKEILTEKNANRGYEIGHRLASPFLTNTPSMIKRPVIEVLKRFKQVFFAKKIEYNYVSINLANDILNLIEEKKIIPTERRWNGKRFALTITHDVDDLKGFNNVREIADLELGFDIPSAWYLVPFSQQYTFERKIVSQLLDDGHEVGLHGYTHDFAFASNSTEFMRTQLLKALKKIGVSNCGFRTPGLSRNTRLIQVLDSLGFLYDTTYPDFDIYSSGGVKTCYPYKFPSTGIYELPITSPNDAELLNMRLSEEEAFRYTCKRIEMIRNLSGVCVLLFHPRNIYTYQNYYEKLLSFINSQKDVWVTTPNTIIEYVKKGKGKKKS